jgi:acyl transferase domain-containing protein/acyl carrier protein
MTEPSEHQREIAVIGLACRFPGAQNSDQFWANLRDGVESISRFTDEELLASGIAPEVLRLPNYVKAGGVLPGIELFDAGFFGMSRREAEMTDPQQRVFLEVAWEGLENAGYDPQRYNGSIGVFAGSSISTYLLFNLVPDVSIVGSGEHFPTLIGNDKDYLATHVSYKLNLHGPSMSIQTACSTSLVAIHTACQSLLNGECDIAIAGGVAISVPQQTGYFYQEGAYFSPDGSCRSFSAGARGTVFGSGAGVVVLKRLEDALRDGDCIDAIVKGSAINNDGATKVGFTAPSVEGQARAISEALAIAEVSLESIGYVEAHGTATPLGDPIEIAALSLAFSSQKLPAASCAIGSVKSNVGHLDSAAGVCGFIKTVLALKHAQVPPSLHCSTPNPNIDFGRTPFYVNTGLRPWPTRCDQPRRAGVSSFGIGGTNAHVVLEEAPSRAPAVAPGVRSHSLYALPLSARSAEALRELAYAYRARISDHTSSDDLRDLCYSASVRRAHHRPHRLCLVANSAQQLVQQLDAFLSYEASGGLFVDSSRGRAGSAPRASFVFSGQGAQWWGMGREVLASSATFRDAIAEIDALFRRHTNDWGLLEELTASEEKSRLDGAQIEITQCTLFALQVALAKMWRAFGVEPVAVIGHSMGEVAAAVVSGALSLEDGVRLIYERGHLLQRAVGQGAMAALELSEDEVLAFLADGYEGAGIAAVNGARATVVSGESEAVARLVHDLTERGLMVRELRTSGVAGHNEQVAGISEDLERVLSGIRGRTSDVSFISTVEGARVAGEQLNAAYWKRNLREPVRFADGMKAVLDEGADVFIEINAHPILGLCVKQASDAGVVIATLRKERSAWDVTVEGLAEIYVAGAELNWQEVWKETRANYVRLPAYPWQRERYWIEPRRRVGQQLSRVAGESGHPLFMTRVQSSVQPNTYFWEVDLQSESLAYLKDHRIQQTVVVPASLYLEIVFAASRELFGDAVVVLNDVTFPRVLLIHPRRSRKLQLVISREEGKFSISSLAEENARSYWTLHASGKIGCGEVTSRNNRQPPEIIDRRHEVVSSADHYDELEKAGLRYGPAFRGVREVFVDGDTCIGRLSLPEDVARSGGHVVHPVLLDSAFQVLTRLRNGSGSGLDIYLPVGVRELRLTKSLPAAADYWGHGTLLSTGENEVETSLSILTEDGSPVLELHGVRARRLALDDYVASSQEITEWFHEIQWIKSPRPNSLEGDPDVVERWLVFSDRSGVGDELSSLIAQRGHDCVQVFAGSEYRNETGKRFEVDPLNPKHFQRLFEEVVNDSENPRLGIVHLWSLDVAHSSNLSPNTLDEARKLACGSLLHLVQAVAHNEPPRLWLITRGSQATGPMDEVSGVAQSMLWGLGKVVRIEHSELNCTRIDLDPAKPAVETAALWNELNRKTDEEEIAFRGGSRFVSRLRQLPFEHDSQPSKSIRSDALYLITGGLGGLGLTVAKWIVDQGARHLVLMSRTGASETTKNAVELLRNAGAEITIFKTDVSVAEELAAALNTIEQMDAPLTGVIHAAGVLDDGLMLRLDWERFERVTKPKIEGAWNLHQQLRDKHLDFFVLFSSAGSMLGAAGQANHVAGNSFLDALAHHRRACSLPALSINWSQWGETGKVANSVESERLQLQGIPRMSNAQGLRALELLLGQDTAQAGIMKFDLEQWSRFYPQALNSSLLRNFACELPGDKSERPDIRSMLRAAQTHRQRLALLEEFVRGEVAWVLRLSPKDIPSEAFFSDLALDSLRSLELRNRLEHGLNLTLPATLVWQFPTVDSLVPHLAEKLSLVSDETKPLVDKTNTDGQARISEIERLSDAEAEVLLRHRLESLQLNTPKAFANFSPMENAEGV